MTQAHSPLRLTTERLELIAVTDEIASADASNRAAVPTLLNATVPAEWPPPLLADHLEQFANALRADPAAVGWWGWYWVLLAGPADSPPLRGDERGRVLIGSGGFLFPDSAGSVMCGYSVLEGFQNRGYATEAMRRLIGWAFSFSRVQLIYGLTFPRLKPSIRVLEKLGFQFAGPGAEEGTIRYDLPRSTYLASARDVLTTRA